jgi:glycosyltransferase involved in cell wall biosynthesis
VDAAIESVGRQTYPDIELIVISAGTSEAEFSRLARALKAGRISGRCIRAAPGGECGAINQGIADASGRLIALLEADDVFAATRVEHLARLVCGTGARWGFSNVAFIDSASRPVSFGERPDVDEAMRLHESLLARFAVSEAVMQSSLLTTAGNLFFERALWQEIGGFKPLRFHRNWLFGLTASLRAEPAYLDEPDYVERIGAVPATREEVRARAEEESVVRASWLAHVERLRDLPNHVLERANKVVRQRDFAIMANGGGHLLDRRLLLKYASELGSEVIPEGGEVR